MTGQFVALRRQMKVLCSTAAIALTLVTASVADASVLTFDDLESKVSLSGLDYGGLAFGGPINVTPYKGGIVSAPHVAIGSLQGAKFSGEGDRSFVLNDFWIASYALEPLYVEYILLLPDQTIKSYPLVLRPDAMTLVTVNREVLSVTFPSRHADPRNNTSVERPDLFVPGYSGQVGAVVLDNIRINEPVTVPVPEPTTLTLLGFAMTAAVLRRRLPGCPG